MIHLYSHFSLPFNLRPRIYYFIIIFFFFIIIIIEYFIVKSNYQLNGYKKDSMREKKFPVIAITKSNQREVDCLTTFYFEIIVR